MADTKTQTTQTAQATELTSQYIAQVTGDLERNTKEQERITADIGALQEQLAALQHDHSVLVNMQQALGTVETFADVASAAARAGAVAPVPQQKRSAAPEAGKRSRGKKAGAAQETGAAKKPAARSTTAKAAKAPAAKAGKAPATKTAKATTAKSAAAKPATAKASAAKPTLVELIRTHLTEQSEPRSAAEITTALGKSHPDRSVKTTVVRTTLEGLVAKSQAQRSKQGSSVFYTASDAAGEAKAPQSGSKAAAEPAGAAAATKS
ncbi:hypothetical protein ACFV6E_39945 [Streptomyces sp. NPDC059785]|uniref:hypothetical protein n=1 Tax=Streptomyces sp. NPDC059785 TaxID=3346945 RepID=UPI003666D0DE